MRYLRAVNADRHDAVLGNRIGVADRWWLRLRGLVGRRTLTGEAELDGLMLEPCNGIHMYGMGFAIDVAFLDADDRVVAVHRNLMPGARSRRHPAARRVLELPAGMLRRTGTREGDRIVFAAAPGANGTNGANGNGAHRASGAYGLPLGGASSAVGEGDV